jgi:dipeptidyl aminopeptidase/acylaminoacyl peptidase
MQDRMIVRPLIAFPGHAGRDRPLARWRSLARGRRPSHRLVAATMVAALAGVANPAGAAFPGSNGKIAFDSNPANDEQPVWSPDGSKIAFTSNRGGNIDVYVMDADGTDPVNVSANPATDWMPAWSPDGSRLAFIAGRDADFELYAMNADGSGQTRLTGHPGAEFSPAWSPDGTRITYNAFAEGNFEIFAIDSDGTDAGNLTNHFAFDSRPDWQPLLSTEAPGIAVAGGACGPADRAAAVDLTLTDVDTSVDDLTVALASDNTVLLPLENLTLTGSGASRRLALTTARNGIGTGVVTVTVSDGQVETSLAVSVHAGRRRTGSWRTRWPGPGGPRRRNRARRGCQRAGAR